MKWGGTKTAGERGYGVTTLRAPGTISRETGVSQRISPSPSSGNHLLDLWFPLVGFRITCVFKA